MATKNTTIRFEEEMIDEIDQSCQGQECTRNDWLKDAAQEKLQAEKAQDQEVIEDTKPQEITARLIDDEPKEEPKATIELIPEPKITIKEVPQDNSNKPIIQFTQFNGKLLPSAKRYDL